LDLVQENLWHHDGVKYRLLAWVIMPNHVHVSVKLWSTQLGEVLKSWKGYTAIAANKLVNRSGAFWEEDYFDRYVRDDGHFCRVVRYIENNPVKAGMAKAPEDWLWGSARHRGEPGPVVPVLLHPTAKRMPAPRL
jgi:REP element-mobilizing transposase RayT